MSNPKIILIFMLFFLFLLFSSNAYDGTTNSVVNLNNEINNSKIYLSNNGSFLTPLYQNTIVKDFIADAPSYIQHGELIPLLLEIHESDLSDFQLDSIVIYDENSDQNIEVIDFQGDGSCLGKTYKDMKDHLWFTIHYLNYTNFRQEGNKIKFSVKFITTTCDTTLDVNSVPLYVEYVQDLPKFNEWYCGDTHYHSSYTDTFFLKTYGEIGAPINATISAMDSIGLDWLIITDHSNAFNGFENCNSSWANFVNECNIKNECLIGEEINCGYTSANSGGNHYLGYNLSDLISDNFGSCSPSESNPSCHLIMNNISFQEGFGYVAHPESNMDILWGLIGSVINKWQNYSLPFTGLQIWNGDLDDKQTRTDLDNGLQKWKDLILQGRKIFISAGTDAHGDFNTKFGKTMTCVYSDTNSSSNDYKQNIFNSLKTGKSYITNNGALKFEIQTPYKKNIQLGDTTNVYYNSSINITIDYNLLDSCNLKIYKGIIGEEENLVNDFGTIENNGNILYEDLVNNNQYYRVECINTSSNKRTYTNPIWINVYNSSYNSSWKTCNKDNKLSAIQSGTSAFDIGYTNKTIYNGTEYQPLVADIDADLDNDIIIFSNDYLMVFDDNLDLISQKQVGALRGQPDIINYDNDTFLEIIAVLQNNNTDNYTVIEYNGTNFNIQQSFDVTDQGGYQNIKCLDFDKDKIIDCMFKDYNGYLHSYNIISNNDNLDYKLGEGTSSNNPLPVFADFDNDNDIDLLIEHNYTITLIDKDKNTRSKYVGNEFGLFIEEYNRKREYCANKEHYLRFANLTGDLSIVWLGSCDLSRSGYGIPAPYQPHSKLIVLNSSFNISFIKICGWYSFSLERYDRTYYHACRYTDPLIYDYNKDGYDEIGIMREGDLKRYIIQDDFKFHIEYVNGSGSSIIKNIPCTFSKFYNYKGCMDFSGTSFADMNNDNKLDWISPYGIFMLNATTILNFSSIDTQQPIPADLNQDGLLDLVWSKQGQTKTFVSEARPSCSDKTKNQDEIDIDCGGACGTCPDSDNDGIADMYDNLYGNSSSIITNFGLINVFVGNSINITKRFNSNQLIEFKNNNNSILSFYFNFSSRTLNLSNIILNEQTDNKTGSILVKGINVTETKTVYINNLNLDMEYVCVKDKEIDSIDEISSYCKGINETLVRCNSTLTNNYNCTLIENNTKYKISGLSHSGVIEHTGNTTAPKVLINEFMPNPEGNDDELMPGGEWIELYNNDSTTINVSGWVVYDSDDSHELYVTNSNTNANNTLIAPNTFLVVYRNGDSDFALNNLAPGDSIRLYDGYPVSSSNLIDSYSYSTSIRENISIGRIHESNIWDNFNLSTPEKTNNRVPILNLIGTPIVNETDIIIITANATDADSDNLTYSINHTKFNQLGNTFSWFTDYDDAGFYSIKINVTDGYSDIFDIFYVNISEVIGTIYEIKNPSSEIIGSTYSSRGVFIEENKTNENSTEKRKGINLIGEGKEEAMVSEDNLYKESKTQKPLKITASAVVTEGVKKASKPIGFSISFGIVFLGLFFYTLIKRELIF